MDNLLVSRRPGLCIVCKIKTTGTELSQYFIWLTHYTQIVFIGFASIELTYSEVLAINVSCKTAFAIMQKECFQYEHATCNIHLVKNSGLCTCLKCIWSMFVTVRPEICIKKVNSQFWFHVNFRFKKNIYIFFKKSPFYHLK